MSRTPYMPTAATATIAPPTYDAATRAFADFLNARLGRATLDDRAYADLRDRGLSRGRVNATVERLAARGVVRVRRINLSTFHVQVA